MEGRRFYITMGELKRYRVTLKCLEGEISAKDASFLLGLSYRQFLRVKKEVKERGINCLFCFLGYIYLLHVDSTGCKQTSLGYSGCIYYPVDSLLPVSYSRCYGKRSNSNTDRH